MGTWNAFYVKAVDDPAILAVRKEFPDAEIDADGPFMGVRLDDDAYEAPESTLLSLSKTLHTDVIWLSFQSAVDAFQFHHWLDGAHLRSLVFGCFAEERTWERIEGKSEPWEREVLFDDKLLKFALECAQTEDEKRELRRIWKEGELVTGRTEPNLHARSCAHKIARHFGLPHYGL